MSEENLRVRNERLTGIDLARFIAIIAMFIALSAPSQGPLRILGLSTYLAVPLFTMLLAIATHLSAQKMAMPMLFASSVVRGILLILLGYFLGRWSAPLEGILPLLGLLSIVVVPLVLLPSWLLGVIALASWYFTAPVQHYFETNLLSLSSGNEYINLVLGWFFTGENYRVFTMLCWGAIGIILIRLMHLWGVAGDIAAFLLSTTAICAIYWYFLPKKTLLLSPGSLWETGFDILLCISVISLCSLVERILSSRQSVLGIFVSAGQMSLSIYLLMCAVLVYYPRWAPYIGLEASTQNWWILTLLLILTFIFVWLWKKFLGRTVLYRGPLETLLAWTTGRS